MEGYWVAFWIQCGFLVISVSIFRQELWILLKIESDVVVLIQCSSREIRWKSVKLNSAPKPFPVTKMSLTFGSLSL